MEIPEWKKKLPASPFKLYDDPLQALVKFYKEHLRRDTKDGKHTPTEFWITLRGFLISAAQTYGGICLLVADKRPKPLMLQAGILNRSLLETLGNVMALCEAPKTRTRILVRESYKNMALTFLKYKTLHGTDEKWREFLDVYAKGLIAFAKEIRVSRHHAINPQSIAEEWPTPGTMIYGSRRRNQSAWLRGTRRAAFKEIYESHYGHQSEQAHQRAAAVGTALLVDDPAAQWNPGFGESLIVSTALLLMACILSELEAKGRYPGHAKLRELWVYLFELNDEAKILWKLRYRMLLKG
jgi:hypothetical protein